MYTILIVEDEKEIRQELKVLLENALYRVEVLEDFANAQQLLLDSCADLILMDVCLPGTDGMELCARLRKAKDTPVIFVTSKNNSMDEVNAMMLGGDDYITKPYHLPVLLAHIAAVLKRTARGKGEQSEHLLSCKGYELNLLNSTVAYGKKIAELTKTQLRLCHMLFSRQGQIVSRADLIEDLWDNQIFIDDNTLSVNMTRLRKKLDEIGTEHIILTKRGQGYLV